MPDPNARVRPRERFELSLDGPQIASIVVGALVILGVVFVLGLNVGKQIAVRRAESARAGDLEALDRPLAPAATVKDESLTFHDRLTRETPAPPPPPKAAASAPTTPAPAAAEPPAAAPPPPPAPVAAAGPPPQEAGPTEAQPPSKPWTVQLAAAQDRGEAEKIVGKLSHLNPRIEEAEVPGKGRFYRVRVGGFDSREDAERYMRDVARETGAKGYVTPSR